MEAKATAATEAAEVARVAVRWVVGAMEAGGWEGVVTAAVAAVVVAWEVVGGVEAERAEVDAGAAQKADHGSQVPGAVAGKARAAGEKVKVVAATAAEAREAAAWAVEALAAAAKVEAALGAAAGREARA